MMARKYAHRIPFIVKINHNDLLVYPERHDQPLVEGVEILNAVQDVYLCKDVTIA